MFHDISYLLAIFFFSLKKMFTFKKNRDQSLIKMEMVLKIIKTNLKKNLIDLERWFSALVLMKFIIRTTEKLPDISNKMRIPNQQELRSKNWLLIKLTNRDLNSNNKKLS